MRSTRSEASNEEGVGDCFWQRWIGRSEHSIPFFSEKPRAAINPDYKSWPWAAFGSLSTYIKVNKQTLITLNGNLNLHNATLPLRDLPSERAQPQNLHRPLHPKMYFPQNHPITIINSHTQRHMRIGLPRSSDMFSQATASPHVVGTATRTLLI